VREETITADGVPLALRRTGPQPASAEAQRPVLLVHGLASNARMWDGVALRLGSAGHPVVAVDQRGHGLSPAPESGFDTDTCADDLAALITALGWVGDHAPAARHGLAAGLALVDGGWLRLGDRFETFDQCWAELAPPSFEGWRYDDLAARIAAAQHDWPGEALAGTLANLVETEGGGVRARLARDHHRSILHSLWLGDPRRLYPLVDVPVLLMPADASIGSPEVAEAAAALADVEVSEYVGAHHDLHAQHPGRCALDLHDLAARADARAPRHEGTDA
jgi:pimeloyl-ACP methyl ester carboxylesterase